MQWKALKLAKSCKDIPWITIFCSVVREGYGYNDKHEKEIRNLLAKEVSAELSGIVGDMQGKTIVSNAKGTFDITFSPLENLGADLGKNPQMRKQLAQSLANVIAAHESDIKKIDDKLILYHICISYFSEKERYS